MLKTPLCNAMFLALTLAWITPAADYAPELQWVKTTGGSGSSSVAAAATDANGDLYIVGSTTSLDFPTTATASQSVAGGSQLVRISLPNASASTLFPANLPPITFAAAAPANPGTLYVASGNQIWKSTDAGSTWTLLYQFSATGIAAGVGGLAVDPTNSSTLYAATGTQGAFKSTDGGIAWTAINHGIPPNPNGSINLQGGVWVEPSSPNVIFAAGDGFLYRSADGGNNWTSVTPSSFPNALVFDPFTAGTIYFATNSAISKSTDNGQTFAPLSQLPSYIYFNALAADPKNAGVLYAGTTNGVYEFSQGAWTLKLAGSCGLLIADPNSSAFYASLAAPNLAAYGIVKSTDGFTTTSPIGPDEPSVQQILISGSNLFEISAPATDVFAVKLDNNGNVVYSTYFGGSGSDSAAALAVGTDGSIYVTGSTNSADLPVTPGVYESALASTNGSASSFVFKLNPNGSLGWATYFTGAGIVAQSIAVDASGNPFIGGTTSGGLPVTPGVYQSSFTQSVTSNGFFGVIGPPAGFVTKFNAQGSGLIYSTYIPNDTENNLVEGVAAMVVDAVGNAWIGVGINPNIIPTGPPATVVELSPTGSALVASVSQPALGVAAIALDSSSDVYVAGSFTGGGGFPATPGAFQSTPQPAIPSLNYEPVAGGGSDAFVAKFDSSLTHLLAATLLGGEQADAATSIALDSSGNVIVSGYTESEAFPTRAPFQALFSSPSGFVAGFDSNLTNLLFSTYLGNGTPFSVQGAAPDGHGNILLAGSTSGSTGVVVANKIALPAAPAVRLDAIHNYASHLGVPLAPGEPIVAQGAGFGSGARIVLDGSPLTTISATATSIVAVMPERSITSGVHILRVSNNGTESNFIYAPAAAAAPAIYSVDGSGFGQGYILNSDGTLNSSSNPAAPGSAITIFVTAPGQYTLSNGYAVTTLTPAVFLDGGIYCDGIAATIGPVNGLPGNVYKIGVYIPTPAALAANDPDLANFTYPAQTGIQIAMGPVSPAAFIYSPMASQAGIFVSIK
jgi:Beta-propeller repeat